VYIGMGIGTAIALFVVLCVIGRRAHKRYIRYIEWAFRQAGNFTPDEVYVSAFRGNSIAVDRERRVFCIAKATKIGVPPEIVTLPASRILQCELLEDEETVQHSRRMATAGGAVLGGMLGGPFGMLAGAHVGGAGAIRSKTEVSSIEVKVLVSGQPEPSYSVAFYKGGPVARGGGYYKLYRPSADRWFDLLRVAALEHH